MFTTFMISTLPADLSPALNTAQAAVYVGLSRTTLERFRCQGGGPRYFKISPRAVRYRVAALDQWIEERSAQHTTDEGQRKAA